MRVTGKVTVQGKERSQGFPVMGFLHCSRMWEWGSGFFWLNLGQSQGQTRTELSYCFEKEDYCGFVRRNRN